MDKLSKEEHLTWFQENIQRIVYLNFGKELRIDQLYGNMETPFVYCNFGSEDKKNIYDLCSDYSQLQKNVEERL
jgi:hypothetical protein